MPLQIANSQRRNFPEPSALTLTNWKKGVITLIDKSRLPKDALEEADNIFLYEDGQPGPRPGVGWYGTAPALTARVTSSSRSPSASLSPSTSLSPSASISLSISPSSSRSPSVLTLAFQLALAQLQFIGFDLTVSLDLSQQFSQFISLAILLAVSFQLNFDVAQLLIVTVQLNLNLTVQFNKPF
jgi:hypothetical protein